MDCSPSRIDELLNKDLAKYSVGFFTEDGAEDDCHSIVTGLYINGLLLSILNHLDLATLAHALGSFLGCKLGCRLLQLVVFLVSLLEWGRHRIALQEGELQSQGIALL